MIPNVSDLLNSTAASVNGLVNTASAEKSAGKAFSDASSRIASINVANLLRVGVVDSSRTPRPPASPAPHTTPAAARWRTSTSPTAWAACRSTVRNLIVNGLPVPVPANLIGTVKGAINSVLNAAGLSVGLCDVANGSKTAADGTSASQTLSALRIQFALPALPGNALGMASAHRC